MVGNEDIVKDDELPKTWGLIVPHGKGLKIKKEAEFNKKILKFDDLMLAGLFRNIADYCIPKELLDIKIKNAVDHKNRYLNQSYETLKKEKTELQDILNEFENQTGLKISYWNKESNKDLIAAIKVAMQGNKKVEVLKKKLEDLKTIGDRIGKYIEGQISDYHI